MQQISKKSNFSLVTSTKSQTLSRSINSRFSTLSKGFTIVELLVVIVVIGILASITMVAYTGITLKSTAAVLQSDLKNASTVLELDKVKNGGYPATEAVANDGKGLPKSTGTIYQYTTAAGSYYLSATSSKNDTLAFYTTSADGGAILAGVWSGHTPPAGLVVAIPEAKILVVAGGGGGFWGKAGRNEGGGGNSGIPYYDSAYPLSVGEHNVVVGAGGISIGDDALYDGISGSGGLSSFDAISVAGGTVEILNTKGGHGASTAGVVGVGHDGGAGGNGVQYSISGTATYYSGGGGGACVGYLDGIGGIAGLGSTGTGATYGTVGNSSAANTGGGGGGGSSVGSKAGGVGGSGVVIIRYLTGALLAAGGVVTADGLYTIHTFNSSGTFTVN